MKGSVRLCKLNGPYVICKRPIYAIKYEGLISFCQKVGGWSTGSSWLFNFLGAFYLAILTITTFSQYVADVFCS